MENQLKPRFITVSKIGLTSAVLIGIVAGLGAFAFYYGEGHSYFSKDPRACVNCHIMQPQFDSWQKSSHHTVATCVECHLPHDFFGKWIAKADNGFWHSKGFTFQDFPEPIQIKNRNRKILENNCKHCHSRLTQHISQSQSELRDIQCLHCHKMSGHGETIGMGKWEPQKSPFSKNDTGERPGASKIVNNGENHEEQNK